LFDVLTFKFRLVSPISKDSMTRGPKTDVNPLVKTPDSSIFYVANVKQLTNFNECSLYFEWTKQLGLLKTIIGFSVLPKVRIPPLFTYLLPDKLRDRVPG